MILIDTSGLFAALVRNQRAHEACRRTLERAEPPFVLSPFVLAELDCFFAREAGTHAELAFLEEVAAGAYELPEFRLDDVAAATRVVARYSDLQIGLADASIVVLAARYGGEEILTLDERHFRGLRSLEDRPFRLLPADT